LSEIKGGIVTAQTPDVIYGSVPPYPGIVRPNFFGFLSVSPDPFFRLGFA
jgi:hypothetical protein